MWWPALRRCFRFSPSCIPSSAGSCFMPLIIPALVTRNRPPAFLGWIFILLGAFFFFVGVTMAICILIAGGCLSRRKAFSSVLVVACVECFFIPFGTILGVFTIVALSRESVRALFSTGQSRA